MAHILVVDDQKEITDLMRLMLEEDGHEIICCNHPDEVKDILEQADPQFDIMIMDVLMPGHSGFDLAEDVKTRHTDLLIMVISGGGRTMDSKTAVSAAGIHADFKLQKPFTQPQLNLAVDALLATRLKKAAS